MTAPPVTVPVPQITAPTGQETLATSPAAQPTPDFDAISAKIQEVLDAENARASTSAAQTAAANKAKAEDFLISPGGLTIPAAKQPAPPPAHSPPRSSVQNSLEFRETPYTGQADTRPEPMGAEPIIATTAAAFAAIAVFATHKHWTSSARNLGVWAIHTIRQRAALVICLGAALVAADWLIFDAFDHSSFWAEMSQSGWISFFGAAASLIGIYHWIAGPPPDKI